MRLHISNLNSNIIGKDLYKMFFRFGAVDDVKIVRDKLNNSPKGRAFVEMPIARDAQTVILQLHRSESSGKRINVSEVEYKPAPDVWTFTA